MDGRTDAQRYFLVLPRAPGGGTRNCAVAHPIHVSNSHTKFGCISSNGLGGDSVTVRRTYGPTDVRTDGGDGNIPHHFFFKKSVGITRRVLYTHNIKSTLS